MRTVKEGTSPVASQLFIRQDIACRSTQWQAHDRRISVFLPALGLVACVALMSGCATSPKEWVRNGFKVGPNYCPPSAPIASAWTDSNAEQIETRAADDGYWWAVFNDPVLNQLVQHAHEQNLSLKAAGMRILEARAQLGVAKGSLFPQEQQAAGSYARNQFSQNAYPFGDFDLPRWAFDNWSVGFDATWELDFWGRYRRAVESADANLGAQMDNYNDVIVILQAEVAATYIEMRTLEDRLTLAQKNLELQRRTLRIARDRFDKGMVSELDVKQAESIVGATESIIPTLQIQHRRARNRLCILLAMPPEDMQDMLENAGVIPSAPPRVAVGIPAELLRRRPDVQRAEREAAAGCARIGIAESELYPHIGITGSIGYEAEDFSQLFRGDSVAGMIGPGFRWNILNYGRIRNNICVHDARFRQLVLQYQETVLRASEEVENAITAYLHEQVRVRSLQQSTQATAVAVELANIQYEQGLIDFQRVLDSERALVRQQDALSESRGNVARNLVAVYKALGGGWQMRDTPNHSPVAEERPDGPTGRTELEKHDFPVVVERGMDVAPAG